MIPEQLRASPRVIELLATVADFDLDAHGEEPWFRLANDQVYEVIGADTAGNLFALVGDSKFSQDRSLLYVCHEGQAGLIATSLEEAVRLFIAAPYWRDLLKFSGGGQLSHMAQAQALLEADLHVDEPEIDSVRQELEGLLRVERQSDPVRAIWQNVTAGERTTRVTSDDGEPFDSLFNSFVPGDNPSWRNRA